MATKEKIILGKRVELNFLCGVLENYFDDLRTSSFITIRPNVSTIIHIYSYSPLFIVAWGIFLNHSGSGMILLNQAMSTTLTGVIMHIKKDNICKVPGNNRFSVNINYCENKEPCSHCCMQYGIHLRKLLL